MLGTRLKHLLDLVDAGISDLYVDLGLPGFRPRFNPIIRSLVAAGPSSIRDLARAIGVTHSAASQTVAQMAKEQLVTLAPGTDARQRIVTLTSKAESLMPVLNAEWDATTAAATALETELSHSLSQVVGEAIEAMCRRPFRQRIADVAPELGHPSYAAPNLVGDEPGG